MDNLIRTIKWPLEELKEPDSLLNREWLVTNGLGGYSSGTISGVNTRRYHGLLVSALPSPLGRVIMLNQLNDTVILPDGEKIQLAGEERVSCALQMHGNCFLSEFSLEKGLPVWQYQIKGTTLEKRLFMRYMQNTVQITWKIVSGNTPISLELHPAVHFRSHHDQVNTPLVSPYTVTVGPDHYELYVEPNSQVLRMLFYGPEVGFTVRGNRIESYIYRQEENHGYPSVGALWSPGYFQVDLKPDQEIIFVASSHNLETIQALSPKEAVQSENDRREFLLGNCTAKPCDEPASELLLAADQFIITPAGRREDTARIRANGDEVRTVVAGYHWFTDWGRDTMISLEGLTLLTGRHQEARWILHTFSHYIRNGLIPNLFPEGEKEGIYNTADATLWFFHALDRYLEYTGDRTTLKLLLPKLLSIVEHHIQGTSFGIGVDPQDGLLRQGSPGYALTWMDAKVGEWVVTPRRGKAVEINALWYNALCLLQEWVTQELGAAKAESLKEAGRRARQSFNERFWYAQGGYLYDVVDGENGDDASCRPNQLLAISLHYPILDESRWETVMNVVTQKLLTPVGLRSLAPGYPDYKPKYFGDIRARDAAYHQGTVWAWLIGPYIDAWLKIYPNKVGEARQFLTGLVEQLNEACVGSISEIFDAETPFTPRGCVAQAWSVAEVLRCWVKTNDFHK